MQTTVSGKGLEAIPIRKDRVLESSRPMGAKVKGPAVTSTINFQTTVSGKGATSAILLLLLFFFFRLSAVGTAPEIEPHKPRYLKGSGFRGTGRS